MLVARSILDTAAFQAQHPARYAGLELDVPRGHEAGVRISRDCQQPFSSSLESHFLEAGHEHGKCCGLSLCPLQTPMNAQSDAGQSRLICRLSLSSQPSWLLDRSLTFLPPKFSPSLFL